VSHCPASPRILGDAASGLSQWAMVAVAPSGAHPWRRCRVRRQRSPGLTDRAHCPRSSPLFSLRLERRSAVLSSRGTALPCLRHRSIVVSPLGSGRTPGGACQRSAVRFGAVRRCRPVRSARSPDFNPSQRTDTFLAQCSGRRLDHHQSLAACHAGGTGRDDALAQ
jgi:hypothetical protein